MPKRLSASWTFESTDFEFANKTDEELEEMRTFYFDRWNWETGHPEDRRLFEAIDKEIQRRKAFDIERELTDALAEEITKEIDRQILEDLLKKG